MTSGRDVFQTTPDELDGLFVPTAEPLTITVPTPAHRFRVPTIRECRVMREIADWSQADFARQVGVSQTQVCRWEQGNATPNADNLRTMVTVLQAAHGEQHARLQAERD